MDCPSSVRGSRIRLDLPLLMVSADSLWEMLGAALGAVAGAGAAAWGAPLSLLDPRLYARRVGDASAARSCVFTDSKPLETASNDPIWRAALDEACGGETPEGREADMTTPMLWNRPAEVPYEWPGEAVLLCGRPSRGGAEKVLWWRDDGGRGRRVAKAERAAEAPAAALRKGVRYLWSVDPEGRLAVHPEQRSRGSFLWDERAAWERVEGQGPAAARRGVAKHADAAFQEGCGADGTVQRGHFRGRMRVAGELFWVGEVTLRGGERRAVERWVLDSDSSYVYYRGDGSPPPPREAFDAVAERLWRGMSSPPPRVVVYPAEVLFPDDVHVPPARKAAYAAYQAMKMAEEDRWRDEL